MNTNKTERQVAAIKNGTVIDHIPAETGESRNHRI